MPVKTEDNGRRYVEAEVEVPGTPEEVWRAIATGPGVSSWFVPTQIEEKVVGHVRSTFGPGKDSVATITAWDPPRHYATSSSEETDHHGPPVATEWFIETRSGSTCIVRVVLSWFAETDEWDSQLEGSERGWNSMFRILKLYLTEFSGQTAQPLLFMEEASGSLTEAWDAFAGSLGIAGLSDGESFSTQPPTPSLSGSVIEMDGPSGWPEALLKLTSPTTGFAYLFAISIGDETYRSIRFFLFGDQEASVASTMKADWQQWISERLS
jgi:uncharacterized protein YndB with AHSA1/START domain